VVVFVTSQQLNKILDCDQMGAVKFCSLIKMITMLEKPEMYSLFMVDYGLCPVYLHTTARNFVIQTYTVKYLIKHV
jgi:hypothetical protein